MKSAVAEDNSECWICWRWLIFFNDVPYGIA